MCTVVDRFVPMKKLQVVGRMEERERERAREREREREEREREREREREKRERESRVLVWQTGDTCKASFSLPGKACEACLLLPLLQNILSTVNLLSIDKA